ncbi:MAG: response regulator, partial [Planctomycetes bacterium]|nr:response regulator [Planctomycetota bacterium]
MVVKAELASAAKSEFLANMSHEIRTPLTAILGYAENLLQMELTAEETQDAIRAVHRNGEHLLQVTDDILNISKIEAGKVQIESLDCSPAEVLDDIMIMMRPRAERKRITLELEHTGRLPKVIRTDPTRLRQILINLVGNAIKYTPEGSVRIRADLTRELPDALEGSETPMLRVEIVDTGIGMSPVQLTRVFQPFTQADETMTRKFGGTGLGLAISLRLAEMLGGTIAAESELGRGSTMRLWVTIGPVDKDRRPEPSPARRLATPDADPTAVDARPLEGLRILLAEDGVDNQRLISLLLERAGAEVELVDNGESAVDAALLARESHRPFHAILMDMQMPVMDGYQATRELRSRDYKGPIIAITAHSMTGDRRKCLDAGCDGYARKPIERRELMTLIRRHARAAQSESPESSTASDRPADALEAPFAEMSARLAELEQALAERDFEALAASAERIREGADRRGLTRLTEAAARLRTTVEARGEMDALREAVDELTALCEQTTRVTSRR